jgi:hypothetical protein
MSEKKEMSVEEILTSLNEKAGIYQTCKEYVSLEVLQRKYENSWNTLLKDMQMLMFSYLTTGMCKEINFPVDDDPEVKEWKIELSKKDYFEFLSALMKKASTRCNQIVKMPSSERKRAFAELRERVLKEEYDFCNTGKNERTTEDHAEDEKVS